MGYRIPIALGNIESLAYKPYRPGRMALVCEGGGQRGIFTAGVLDEFLRAGFNPFDLMVGTSAGAQNLSAYISGQQGYARRVITRFTTSPQFFNPLRFVRGGHLIDLDWLLDTTHQQMPLDFDHAEQQFAKDKKFLICASRSDDFSSHYFTPTRDSWLNVIKASSAIPGFYRQGVEVDGVSYQDGGISDPIPVEEAYRREADTIVVIRTVPSQTYYTPQWVKRVEHLLSESSLQQMVQILQYHQQSYHRIQSFIDNPPGDVRIFEIFPPKPLASNALGSRMASLNQDYHLGRRTGRYFLATAKRWLLARKDQKLVPRVTVPQTAVLPANQSTNLVLPSTVTAALSADNIPAAAEVHLGIERPIDGESAH